MEFLLRLCNTDRRLSSIYRIKNWNCTHLYYMHIFWECSRDLKRKRGFYIWGFPLSRNKKSGGNIQFLHDTDCLADFLAVFFIFVTQQNLLIWAIYYRLLTQTNIIDFQKYRHHIFSVMFCVWWMFLLRSRRSGSKSKWGWFCWFCCFLLVWCSSYLAPSLLIC